MTPSVAFVTPSYRLDFEHCALLNRSLAACATSYEHWIVVDRGDLRAFRPLQDNRTNVVAKEEFLPLWVRRVDTLKLGLRSNLWLHARGLPIRGWLLQQMVKFAAAERLSADVLVHADSDVVFIRPFSAESLVDGDGRVRLYERPAAVDEQNLPDHVRWHRAAEKLLDVEQAGPPLPDFVSSLVPWKRRNAQALLEHVEKTTGKHWFRALADAWHVSEYTLYGRFVRDVLGAEGGQFVSSSPLCLDYYKRVPLSVPELTTFLDGVQDDAIAVSLTSKAGMKPEEYVELLERRWTSADLGGTDTAFAGRSVGPARGPALTRAKRQASEAPTPDGAPPSSRTTSRTPYRRLVARVPRPWVVGATIALLGLTMVLVGLGID